MTSGPETALHYREWLAQFLDEVKKVRGLAMLKTLIDVRIDNIAREMTSTLDKAATDFLRGQLAICYEFADGIAGASEDGDAKANGVPDLESFMAPEVET